MAAPFRVLHIVTYMGRGGLETLLMNCYRNIDREKIQFDFLVHRQFRADYDDEIEALGGRIYRLPRLNPIDPGYFKALKAFFREHPEYRIVHSHLDCMSAFPLKAAKAAGVPVRIAHAHSSDQDKNWKYVLKRYYMRKIPKYATQYFACSEIAGQWMFPGQQVTVIRNGVETARFSYDPEKRAKIRQLLELENRLCIGHVGRFAPQKNHDFLIEIFAEVHKMNPDAVLLLVGEGVLENKIREKVRKLNLEGSVRFLGVRSDVHDIMQAMDVFVLPSVCEGLGMVAVEAQTAGMRCVVSCGVPEACDLTGNVTFLPLEAGPRVWADAVASVTQRQRISCIDQVISAGYDIQTTADWLQTFYLEKEMRF